MTALNMPGFTAQASLYKAGWHLRMAATQDSWVGKGDVLPQLPMGFCMANCDSIEDDFMRTVCEMRCSEDQGGGGGGGGGGGHPVICKPQCGPCRADDSSSTGGFQTCIKPNCDDYDRPCRPRVHPRPGQLGAWAR